MYENVSCRERQNARQFHPIIWQAYNRSRVHCAITEECTQSGIRTLLRFATETRNIGNADLVLGNPVDNELFHFHACHNHYHMEDYADYRLVDDQGVVVSGFKSSSCLLDSYRFDPCASPVRICNCSNQGLQVSWADKTIECG